MPAIDGAAAGVSGDSRPQRRVGNAETDLLAFHVSARLKRAGFLVSSGEEMISAGLCPVRYGHSREEQDRHCRENSPTMFRRTGHAAERVSESGANGEDREHLDQVRQ